MDWDKLRVFHAVAEAGSFTHAGETLNLSQSSVSRQIGTLEKTLNAPLFHRHARGLKLTETGETLYRTAKEVSAKLAMAEAMVSDARDRPSGPLRINTTVAFGSIWLTERLKDFIDAYPEIQITLVVSEDELDVGMGEVDVAIRMTPPRHADLIQRRLATMHHAAFAAPSYLNEYGTPHSLEDLDRHRLIAYDTDSHPHPPFTEINWMLTAGLGPGRSRGARFSGSTISTACTAPRRAGSASRPCPTTWASSPTISFLFCRKWRGRPSTSTLSTPKSCATPSASWFFEISSCGASAGTAT